MRAYSSGSACLCQTVSVKLLTGWRFGKETGGGWGVLGRWNNMFISTGDAGVIDYWLYQCDCMDVSVWLSSPGVLHTTQPTCIHESVSARLERTTPDWHYTGVFPNMHSSDSQSNCLQDAKKKKRKSPFFPLSRLCVVCHVWFMRWEGAHDCCMFVHKARWDYSVIYCT